jgi:hypothetical protein
MQDSKHITTAEQRAKAYAAGADAARAAASWIDTSNAPRLLAMLEEGDPVVDDFLPACPNLSGEWADSLTPVSLAHEIASDLLDLDGSELDPEDVNTIAEAWEEGVSDTFERECERILRATLE